MCSRNIEDHLKFSECFPLPLQRCCQVDWVLQEMIRKKLKKGIEPFFFFLNHLTMVALHGSAQLSEVKQTDLRRDNTS